jgi:hypothetical protein
MFLRIECPGCKAVLQVEEALAGKQGKCIHCGHKIVVPGGNPSASAISSPPAQPAPPSTIAAAPTPPPRPATPSGPAAAPAPAPVLFLAEASPEAMVRELHDRNKSALLLVFEPSAEGSYDLADVPDAKLKCVATEDITQARFAQLIASFAKRFAGRKQAARPPEGSMVGRLSGEFTDPNAPYELKGDPLGMSLADFKQKYARFTPDGRQDLPICSDQGWGMGKSELHSENWHRRAGIVHARVDHPHDDNSPTLAGVKTDLLLYQFVDGQLFRISAYFATDLFHLVSDAVMQKFGPPSHDSKQPRELGWENEVSRILLSRGTVHPRTPSQLQLTHTQLASLAESRTPKGAADI